MYCPSDALAALYEETVDSFEVLQEEGYIVRVWVSGMDWMPDDAMMLYGTLHLGNGDNQNIAATNACVKVLGRDETAYLIQQRIWKKESRDGSRSR